MSRKTRKLIWSAPLVAVLAVVGALAIFAALAPNGAQAHEGPAMAVENLMAEQSSADKWRMIDVSWDSVVGADAYRLDRSNNGNVWMAHEENLTANSYTDMGLKAGTSYYYRVFALKDAGNGEYHVGPVSRDVLATTATPTTPGMVTGLSGEAVDQNSIRLSWSPPDSDGGSEITKYAIHYADPDGDIPARVAMPETDTSVANEGVVVTDDAMTSFTHKELTADTRYRYQVYAVNAQGSAMNPSGTDAATTEDLDNPDPVTGLEAVQTSVSDIDLYWYAPADDGGADISKYIVEHRIDASGDDSSSFGDWMSKEVSDLKNSRSYQAQVTANNADRVQVRVTTVTTGKGDDEKKSDPTPTVEEEMFSEADRLNTIPGEPTSVMGERDGFDNVDLTWVAPPIESDDNTADNAPDSIGGYRIDVSKDGIDWMPLVDDTNRADEKYHYNDPSPESRWYRVFAYHGQHLGPASSPPVEAGFDAGTEPPGYVDDLTATAVGPARIDLRWTAPDAGSSAIDYYVIQRRKGSDDSWKPALMDGGATVAPDPAIDSEFTRETTTYSHTKLMAGETWEYRVIAVSKAGYKDPEQAITSNAKTHQEAMPDAPAGLIAEAAKDTNDTGITTQGVLLLWNASADPAGAEISHYVIERSVDGGAYEELGSTDNAWTHYTDSEEPEAGEMRMYRVYAVSTNDVEGAAATVSYPLATHMHVAVSSAPMNVMATADSDTQITVSWGAPANNGGGAVTGYIIERRYAGDMMGDIPSDGYNGNAGGASFAFSNHMEWWETLNCKGMLAAAGSDEDPTGSGPDKMMYCAHYSDTAPTNMAGTIVAGDATDMAIEALFDKRYVLINDAATMTHVDTNLMEETEYTYRVSAVNSAGRSMWSSTAMATTESAMLEPVTNVMATTDGAQVTITWEGGDNAETFTVVMVTRKADGSWDIDNAVYDQNLRGSGHTVSMETRPAGTYVIGVAAGRQVDGTWEFTDWASGSVDYQP